MAETQLIARLKQRIGQTQLKLSHLQIQADAAVAKDVKEHIHHDIAVYRIALNAYRKELDDLTG